MYMYVCVCACACACVCMSWGQKKCAWMEQVGSSMCGLKVTWSKLPKSMVTWCILRRLGDMMNKLLLSSTKHTTNTVITLGHTKGKSGANAPGIVLIWGKMPPVSCYMSTPNMYKSMVSLLWIGEKTGIWPCVLNKASKHYSSGRQDKKNTILVSSILVSICTKGNCFFFLQQLL